MSRNNENILNKISFCEVCGNHDLESVLDLGHHAMCDDLIKIGDSNATKKYPISILFCDNCKTAHQEFQVPKHMLFPETYHYRAALTKDVLNGMQDLVSSCESNKGSLKNKKILDIGCNDGSLLSIFKDKGALTYGIEPTNAAIDAKSSNHVVVQDYFSPETAANFVKEHGKPDITTFTNVFAHIENLADVLNALNILMQDSDSLLVIENHYLGSVLDSNQFDTFYHEHPRTYSYTSFKHIAKSLNAVITLLEFPRRYGGNIRVFISREDLSVSSMINEVDVLKKETLFKDQFLRLSKNTKIWCEKKRDRLMKEINQSGKLRAKAFPGRAAILLELLGLTEEHISAVYEQPASPKIGHYVPGTLIPIMSDEELDVEDPSPIINLAWHIDDEIKRHMHKLGYSGRIIPIVSNDDFTGS
jgi:hypothetical protein